MPNPPKRFSHLEWRDEPPRRLGAGDFLRLKAHWARNVYEDGTTSRWYQVESVWPPFLDAVVLLLYHRPRAGEPLVCLRRSIRPAITLRQNQPALRQLDRASFAGEFWELPAGGVEPPDLANGPAGLRKCARREAWEEAGLELGEEAFAELGEAPFSAPAMCTERLHYLAAEVDPDQARPPEGDGHPMEEGAEIRFLALSAALAWCRQGKILDTKTELGLWRLGQWLGQPPCGSGLPGQGEEA
ncbi:MAG: NUDIX domain-containing protein [Deltaproteobacteria bacterium]|nr:NUDIX domain-containing protein [Deltaproteobacteria bacterium]